MIKLVVFDLDDTLYNEKNFVHGGFSEVSRYLSEKYNLIFDDVYASCIYLLKSNGRGKIFNNLCEEYKINESIDKLVDVYRKARPKLELYEDAKFILNHIRHNYYTGIITDGMASVQWNKIRSLELEAFIDKIIVTDDFGKDYWKPHFLSFEQMLNYFEVKAEEAVYIGDNPNKDFIGAREIGYKTIRIIRPEGDHMNTSLENKYEADLSINNLKEILEYI